MSTYRNYSPWNSRGSSYTSTSDKAPASPSTVDRGSRYSTNYRQTSPSSSSSSYRPTSLAFTSVRERAATVEATPPKLPVLGKYSSRSYGTDTSRSKTSPEPTSDRTKASGTPSYRRFGSSSYTTTETPVLRYGSSTRFGSQIARSPISEKSPTVFGVSSPSDTVDAHEDNKHTSERVKQSSTVVMVTRGTSPTPPPNSTYLRKRRAEMDKTSEQTVGRSTVKLPTSSVEVQTEEKQTDSKNKDNKYSVTPTRNVTSLPSRFTQASSSSSSYSPSTSSAYSSRYTPRSSTYAYSRPTELPLKSISVSKASSQENLKPPDSPSAGEETKKSKFEGKDSTRIGGFSYTKQKDLPLVSSLNKTPTPENEGKPFSVVSSKDNIPSPQTESVHDRLVKSDSTNRNSLSGETIEVTLPDNENKNRLPVVVPRSNNISSDNSRLPPPAPKNDNTKNVFLNKDFRKSVLNMDLFSSSESSEMQRNINLNSDKIQNSSDPLNTEKRLRPLISSKSISKMKYCKSASRICEPQKTDSSDESNSEYSTSSESSESSEGESSDDEYEVTDSKLGKERKVRVPASEAKVKGSSAEELSKSFEKPPIPPASPAGKKVKSCDSRTEEAKAVVVRALAPITEKMKVKYVGINPENGSDEICRSIKDSDSDQQFRIKRIESGERAWWLESNTDIPSLQLSGTDKATDKNSSKTSDYQIKRIESGERAWWIGDETASKQSNSNVSVQHQLSGEEPIEQDKMKSSGYKIKKIESGDRAWWMGSSGDEKSPKSPKKSTSNASLQHQQSGDELSKKDKSTSSGYKIKKIESGERAWWMGSSGDEKSPKKSTSNASLQHRQSGDELTKKDKSTSSGYKIKKIESGERAWWMENSSDDNQIRKTSSNKSIERGEGDSVGYKTNKSLGSGEETGWMGNSGEDIAVKKSSTKSISKDGLNKSESSDYKIKKIQSGERAWWLGSSSDERSNKKGGSNKYDTKDKNTNCDNNVKTVGSRDSTVKVRRDSDDNTSSGVEGMPSDKSSEKENSNFYPIQRIESGEPAWRLQDADNDRTPAVSAREEPDKTTTRSTRSKPRPSRLPLFIGRHTNIDDLLGTEAPPPAAFRTPNSSSEDEDEKEECLEIEADQVRIHDSTARTPVIERRKGMIKLDDTALQLYKDGDYGSYLDLDASINEQQEEFENFQSNRKNSIVLRTQLSVRVHTIIEKLVTSEGRELRRALFSLKQIFQEDKDLVHEFVQNDGLSCLIKVGSDADQNYQNYILRALGQVMLYVDGMNGVIEHSPTIQWLYSLVASKFRLVVKTALKLLLVFVEYTESNSVLLIKAIQTVDSAQASIPWANIIKLLKEYDAADTELLIYATSLINKTLNGLPDQDSYYDQVDALEEQGFEEIIRRYMSKQGTDLDLLRQFQIYEAVLHHEDGEEKGTPLKQLDETIKKALRHRKCLTATLNQVERRKSRRHSTGTSPNPVIINLNSHSIEPNTINEGYLNTPEDAGVTPALRRRRERAERQRSFIREQREANLRASLSSTDQSGSEDGGATRNRNNGGQNFQNGVCNGESALRRENTVKDLTQKLNITLNCPVEEGGKPCRVGDMKGIISKAKEGLAKSQSRSDVLKSPSAEIPPPIRPPEIKKSETELHWEELTKTSNRELSLCDLDFTDLADDEDHDVLAPASGANGIPPPPPQLGVPPPAPAAPFAPPPMVNVQTRHSSPICKNKKTVKLFWKEVRADPLVFAKLNTNSLIWDELAAVIVDTQKLEHLFESRAKDLITKKQQELNKNKEIIVLDPKRSNAINIGMTKLPPPRSIKTAILKMDATVMNREGIEKLLTMLPTEEERSKIQEAQAANPDLPLGNAEQFLLTLASISELSARLKLWAFKLDFEISEKEIAEPLMDLKQGMETLKSNNTFRAILSTLLSIGIFLNGSEVKGFQIDYLAKVPEVKDTVHKHSLLHHLCHMVMEKFPESTDLYSEIGTITRASKIDFDELAANIIKMESECKASFDHLKIITKHDGAASNMKVKLSDFLADCAERIIVLTKVHRRVMNRYHKFCLWLGIPFHRVQANKPNELCRIISEFALEYRTTRERVLQQLEKKASHRERNKTRGKMITEVGKFRSQEDRADAELKQLLGNDAQDDTSLTGSLPWRRQLKKNIGRTVLGPLGRSDGVNGNLTDADDEIIESLVKTATKAPTTRTAPRERKRTRHAERKSLRRTLRNGLSDEERKHLAAYIKSY